MLSELRADYENYKKLFLAIQAVRVTNTTYGTFTFWNISLRPDPIYGLSLIATENPLLLITSLLLGLVMGVLLLIKLPNRLQYFLTPILAFGFYISSHKDSILGLILTPLAAILLLLAIRAIIRMANYFNRV